MKRRKFRNNGGKKSVDKYIEIDQYIPEAEAIATEQCKDVDSFEWSALFSQAMNTILHKKGLRVL